MNKSCPLRDMRLLVCMRSKVDSVIPSKLQGFFRWHFAFLVLSAGCFSTSTSGPLQNKDLKQLLQGTSFLHAVIQSKDKGDAVELDKLTADVFLQSLLPIKSAKKQHSPLQGIDYEYVFQSGRNPLWVSVDVSGTNNQLIYQIDEYVYTGGSITDFLMAVEKAGIDVTFSNEPPIPEKRVNNQAKRP